MDMDKVRQGNVKEITAALPDLTDAQLVELSALEAQDASPRKGVLDAILAEKHRRTETTGEEGGDGNVVPGGATQAADAAPAWQDPGYLGPLTGEQAQWRLAHIKPTTAARTK